MSVLLPYIKRKIHFIFDLIYKRVILIGRIFKLNLYLMWPKTLYIEITNLCNANCRMCPRHDLNRQEEHMDTNLYKKIIDEASAWFYKPKIHLVFLGEPLLHPDFIKLVIYAKSKGLVVSTISNGYAMNNEYAQALIESGLDEITFSLDSLSKKIYEQIRIGLDFDIVQKNIHNLLRLKKELNSKTPEVQISMVIQDLNRHEKDDFIKYWIDKVKGVYFQYEFKDFEDGGRRKINNNINKIISERRKSCYYLDEMMVIYSSGQVTVCPADDFAEMLVGDSKLEKLLDIWRGDKYKNLRRKHMEGEYKRIKKCANCDYWRGYNVTKEEVEIGKRKLIKDANELCENYRLKK